MLRSVSLFCQRDLGSDTKRLASQDSAPATNGKGIAQVNTSFLSPATQWARCSWRLTQCPPGHLCRFPIVLLESLHAKPEGDVVTATQTDFRKLCWKTSRFEHRSISEASLTQANILFEDLWRCPGAPLRTRADDSVLPPGPPLPATAHMSWPLGLPLTPKSAASLLWSGIYTF